MTNNDYGFIITRHVNSEKTNKYWNKCVRCIREFYPFRKIVIIDDNSNQKFVKSEMVKKKYEGMKVTDRMIIISKIWNSDKNQNF